MIHHIVCCYFGPRRLQLPELEKNSMYFLEQQIEKINKYASKDVKKLTIVVNPYNDEDLLAKEHIKKIRKDIKCEVVFRNENKGFSYEAWHDIILQNIEDTSIKYFMLSEDDYAPSTSNYDNHFVTKMRDEGASACFQLYAPLHGYKPHAAISNGMLCVKSCRELFNKHGKVFHLKDAQKNYQHAEYNQVNFLNYFTEEGKKVADMSSDYFIPFLSAIHKHMMFEWKQNKIDDFEIVYYGKLSGIPVLSPIMEGNDGYRFTTMQHEDLPFFNEVRNLSREFLHDNSEYTLEETESWFSGTKPSFFIIWKDFRKIGYFRTSNLSKKNKNIYIGADLHPDFRGKGHGYSSYIEFINNVFEKNDTHKISLEVLATNQVAISLYKKLGFIHEGCKRQEVSRGDEFIDSNIMSLLREEWAKNEK